MNLDTKAGLHTYCPNCKTWHIRGQYVDWAPYCTKCARVLGIKGCPSVSPSVIVFLKELS